METITEILWPGIEEDDLLQPEGPHTSVDGTCGGVGIGPCACNMGTSCWPAVTG